MKRVLADNDRMKGKLMTKVNGASQEPHPLQSVAISADRPQAHSVEEALRLQTSAALRRAGAPEIEESGDVAGAMFARAEAADMDAAAVAFLGTFKGKATPGNGGELMDLTPDDRSDYPRMVDTLTKSPSTLNAEASRERLELAAKARGLTLGVDLAETIKARNSMERMLAHHLGVLHRLAMLHAAKASDLLRGDITMSSQAASIEANRNATTAAKLATAFQTGCLAFERMRRGGRQTVRVVYQQVAVGKGGKANVVGIAKAKGGSRRRGTKGGGRRNAV